MTTHISKALTVLLASIFALSPFAIDTYLPAITIIAQDLNSEAEWVSVTVSLYVFGLAFGQLIGGPLSDSHGRRNIMLLGISIFAISSCLIATTQNIESFWIFRVLQALGGGISSVCVPALIRDRVSGADAAKLFALVALIMMIAPAIAPGIGSLILHLANWPAIFIFLAVFAFLIAFATIKLLPDVGKSPHTNVARSSFLEILSHRQAIKYLLAQCFGYSVLMVFLTNSPLIYMQYFALSANDFALFFSLNVLVIIISNRLNAWLLNYYQPHTLLCAFLLIQLSGGLMILLCALYFANNIVLVFIGFALAVGAISGIGPNAQACYFDYFAKNAGSASAVFGFSQHMTGASVSALSAALYNMTLLPVSIVLVLCSSCAVIAVNARQQKRST
ncbi:multidrug effflux MFS transporter [Catenovulum sediminis]|uniref:Bcr/CflA family efflux transporter n=1 Tax=Catenovulum sediminis TaxID=1740262 RepID=A0ABV1RLT5_9ALTE